MKKLFLPVLAALMMAIAPCALGQGTLSASDATNLKIHQLDLLVALVPLALQKDQFPDLIDALDKAKEVQKKEQAFEDGVLAKLDPDVATAVENGKKGIFPPREIQSKVSDAIKQMSGYQLGAVSKMIKLVYDAIQAKLNAGQRKAMAESFQPGDLDIPIKPEDVTEAIKINFFVKRVLLDPASYDLLVEMSKHAS